MRHYFLLLGLIILGWSCDSGFSTVEGNGIVDTRDISLSDFEKLEVSGNFKVKIVPSNNFKVVIETDENLQRYVIVDQVGNRVKIKTKNNARIRSRNGLNVTVYMAEVSRIELAGSCVLKSAGKLEHSEKMEITIAGSGDAELDVKTPEVKVSIGGSGKVNIQGNTRDLKVSIAGSGDYEGVDLMSETADINIAGSGKAKVYSSMDLKVSIAGSGDVYYAGNPAQVKKSIAGAGVVKAID